MTGSEAAARATVLIVEDERIVARDLQQTLVEMGYDAFATASSCEQALAFAAARCPDVVLMDIRIKGAHDGIEAARMLREHYRTTVIYLTAHSDDAMLDRAKLTEPHAYLLKPVNAAELRGNIEIALYKRKLEQLRWDAAARDAQKQRELDAMAASLQESNTRSREQLRIMIEAAPTGMLLLRRDGTVMLVNARIEELFGHPRAELLGRGIDVLVPERFRRSHVAWREGFFSATSVRAMGEGRELFGLRKNGEEVPVEIGLTPFNTPDGEFVVASVVDVSQRREMERLRSDFVSTVSHELRTPLTSITGALGLIQSGAMGALPDPAAAMLKIAYENSGRLTRIINDILDIAKIEAGQIVMPLVGVPLLDVLRRAVESHASYAEKFKIRFVLEHGNGSDCVLADADRLTQVLSNLLSNAAKFSAPGADVIVRAWRLADVMRIEVQDCGPGIPEAFKSRIFERFAQADASAARRGEGTGLGLSIARGLIEAMGGNIGFHTAAGGGTVFYVELSRC